MNKQNYLESIKNYFKQKNVVTKQIDNVLSEYGMLYDEAIDSGYDHDAIVKRLGTPESIYKSLKADLSHQENPKDKYIAISPFISVIIFMALGFGFNLWHPGWVVFLSIPLSAVLLADDKDKWRISTIFIATIAYFISSYLYSPIYAYAPLFYLVPALLLILKDTIDWKSITTAVLLVAAVITQLLLGVLGNIWDYTWLIYLIPVIFGAFTNKFIIVSNIGQRDYFILVSFIVIVVVYLLISFLIPNAWGYSWLVFLCLPIIAIYKHEKFKHPVAYMPFISTFIFFGLGLGFGLFNISWMAYLLIPIVAILTENKTFKG